MMTTMMMNSVLEMIFHNNTLHKFTVTFKCCCLNGTDRAGAQLTDVDDGVINTCDVLNRTIWQHRRRNVSLACRLSQFGHWIDNVRIVSIHRLVYLHQSTTIHQRYDMKVSK